MHKIMVRFKDREKSQLRKQARKQRVPVTTIIRAALGFDPIARGGARKKKARKR